MIVEGNHGKLECLSLADYGKDVNVKADFLGLSRNIEQVAHTELLPLSKKWVVTISTQYGCSMGCTFCDVPKVGRGLNATYDDLIGQVISAISLHPEIRKTNRLNIHYARMGEPTWNESVLDVTNEMHHELKSLFEEVLIHPVVSTMMPKHNQYLKEFLSRWIYCKNIVYEGDAGLQLSINSTSEDERKKMFSSNAMNLERISEMCRNLERPRGRKITLNFAVAGYEIDPIKLRDLFDPQWFIVKLTPMHKTSAAVEHDIKTSGDYTSIYPYLHIEQQLKDVGFDVLVFVASEYEDMGRITCGNAILSGNMPDCPYSE